MKHPVKTLAALSIIAACAPSAQAATIKDEKMSLDFGVRLQARAQVSDATDTTGQEYRVNGGVANSANDPVDFSMRRTRLYLKFKYGEGWSGQLAFAADEVDEEFRGDNRGLQVRYAWIAREFKLDGGMKHKIQGGLDKPYNNPSDSCVSSSAHLFPNGNAAAGLVAPRGVGIGYRFNHPVFLVAADVQNNTHNAAKDNTGINNQESEGLYYGARVEFSFSPEWFIHKRAESFLGKEGHGFNLGLSYGIDQDQVLGNVSGGQPGQRTDTAYGVDGLFWWNNISAYAEYRVRTRENTRNDNVAVADVDSEAIVLQVGYAIPLEDGTVIEPAIRYQIIDGDTDNSNEIVNFGDNAETGASGTQIDIGLNYYLNGHNSKFMLALSLWEAEEGQADATIGRLQYQVNF